MRKVTITAVMLAAFSLAATDYATAAPRGTKQATGAIRGTKEKITFEGLVHARKFKLVPNGYDGLNWFDVFAVGKHANSGEGFHSVIHGKVAADFESQGQGVEGTLSAPSGTFSLKSGHFGAATNAPEQTTFSAYKGGVLVGTKQVTLDPADTLVKFDTTFSNIDTVVIDGSGDGGNVVMDNLIVSF